MKKSEENVMRHHQMKKKKKIWVIEIPEGEERKKEAEVYLE